MVIQINTEEKVITVLEEISFAELKDFLKERFPHNWKEWRLRGNSYISVPIQNPIYPFSGQDITCSTTTITDNNNEE